MKQKIYRGKGCEYREHREFDLLETCGDLDARLFGTSHSAIWIRNHDLEASSEGILEIEIPQVHRLLYTPSNMSTILRKYKYSRKEQTLTRRREICINSFCFLLSVQRELEIKIEEEEFHGIERSESKRTRFAR